MDKQSLSTLRFDSYKIHSLHYFENKNFVSEESIEIDYGLGVNIEVTGDKHSALVTLNLGVFEGAEEKNYPFTLRVSITGLFATDDNIEPDQFMDFCKINATAILYPYLRSAVTDITKIANQQPLVMPLVNVYNLIKQSEKEE